jgi:4-amino-4-deoxy-L-arabinose transferase-like glycosyltransferase
LAQAGVARERRARLLRQDSVIVGGLTLLAIALRVPYLGRAYWIDEGISIGIASHRLSHIPALLHEDGSPPLFYFALHFWVRAFGTSEIATHSLPLALSLACIPAGYWAGREIFGRRAGLVAAALMATNPFLNWYSTETRMYPLVVLFAIVGLTFAWRAFRDRSQRDAMWAVVVFAAILYTHDWGIYLTAATGLTLFTVAWYRGDHRLAWWVAGCGGATFLLWLPWVPAFLYQAGNTAAPWAIRPDLAYFFADPSTALGGTIGIIVVPLLVLGAAWSKRAAPAAAMSPAGPLAAIGMLTTLAGFLGAQLVPSWTVRYLAVIVAPFLLAAAGALAASRQGRRVAILACSILTGWALIGLVLPNPGARYAKDNMAAVARAASGLLRPGDVVVITQTEQIAVAAHYLPNWLQYVTPTGPVSDPGVVDWRNIADRLRGANPCQAVAPSIDALPVGSAVLEINPDRALGKSGTKWSKAVYQQLVAVGDLIIQDPALKLVAVYNPDLKPAPYAPVYGMLFVKTNYSSACRP